MATMTASSIRGGTATETTARGGAIVVIRHGERLDYALRDSEPSTSWIHGHNGSRPWDPPLTDRGVTQCRLLGCALAERHLPRLLGGVGGVGLGTVGAVYTSPLVRCVQTATATLGGYRDAMMTRELRRRRSAGGAGDADEEADPSSATVDHDGEDEKKEAAFVVDDDPGYDASKLKVRVEPGLVESMCEDWYRSWCLPDSDSTWGGPRGNRTRRRRGGGCDGRGGVGPPDESRASCAVDGSSLHPMAKVPAGDLFLGADELSRSSGEISPANKEVNHVDVDSTYTQSCLPAPSSKHFEYRWDSFETRERVHDRVEFVAETLARRHPDETIVLVSHGGPVTFLFERLTGRGGGSDDGVPRHGASKFSGCSVYTWREEEGGEVGLNDEKRLIWTCLMANDTSHTD